MKRLRLWPIRRAKAPEPFPTWPRDDPERVAGLVVRRAKGNRDAEAFWAATANAVVACARLFSLSPADPRRRIQAEVALTAARRVARWAPPVVPPPFIPVTERAVRAAARSLLRQLDKPADAPDPMTHAVLAAHLLVSLLAQEVRASRPAERVAAREGRPTR